MKKFSLVLLLLLGGCCAVERNAVKQVEDTHAIILPDYVQYVEADATKTPEQKDDRKKLVESLKHVVEALKKSTE
jgi:hypothetical protein